MGQTNPKGPTVQHLALMVRDINESKSGFLTITVVQADGERFKTLAKNVVIP